MAWRANILSVAKVGGNVVPRIQFLDDETEETFVIEPAADNWTVRSLAEFCERRIVSLEARDQAALEIKAGPVTLPRDSDDETSLAAREAMMFFAIRSERLGLESALNDGNLKDQTRLDELRIAEKTAFRTEYAADPRYGKR